MAITKTDLIIGNTQKTLSGVNTIKLKQNDGTEKRICTLKYGNEVLWDKHYDKIVSASAATCTKPDHRVWQCDNCWRSWGEDYYAEHQTILQNTATLHADGQTYTKCTVCNGEWGHEYSPGGIILNIWMSTPGINCYMYTTNGWVQVDNDYYIRVLLKPKPYVGPYETEDINISWMFKDPTWSKSKGDYTKTLNEDRNFSSIGYTVTRFREPYYASANPLGVLNSTFQVDILTIPYDYCEIGQTYDLYFNIN